MGRVIFDTDVDKTVDIDKNVTYNVNKNVATNVRLDGSLASAEASADAVGGGGSGSGERTVVPFNPDNLTTSQIVTANPAVQNPVEDTITLPGGATDFNTPPERTLFAEVLGPTGQGDLAVQIVTPGRLSFQQGDATFSNSYAHWDLPGGPAPFADLGNADVLANPGDYLFTFNDVSFNPGTAEDGTAATVRVSFLIEDTGGNQAITTVAFVPGDDGQGFIEADDLDIVGSFAALIGGPIIAPPGTVIDSNPATNARIVQIGTETDADGNGDVVNLQNLASFQILLEDRPDQAVGDNTFSSQDFFAFNTTPGIQEVLSVSGTDAATSWQWTNAVEEENVFNIAETETFAQVTEDGAFSFSDALAATNAQVLDDLV